MITIAAPIIGKEETDAVNEVLRSGMLAQGPKVAELEQAFADYCGTKYGLALNSGTAAIHAALHAAGVGAGDEVITTPFSFIATINPVLMQGATPVLVDIDESTYNIDPALVKNAITPKTKAIIAVDLYGQPADWDELRAIADEHNIVLIEDACQAIGAEYKGRKAGSLADIACFSLYATKNVMCGEGGAITTDNEEYVTAIKSFRQHGMVAPYEYEGLGFNYRLTDLQAAIAVEQLKKVDAFTAARQKNAAALNQGLKDTPDIVIPTVADDRTHVYHQYTIRLTGGQDRAALIDFLRSKDVGCGVYYPKGLHTYPHIAKLGYNQGDFPIAEQVASTVLSLPVHPGVTESDVQTITAAVIEGLNNA